MNHLFHSINIICFSVAMDFQHILDNLFINLNECRMHPGATARKMHGLKAQYQGRILKSKVKTREGAHALDDLIQDFSRRNTIDRRLKWSFALHMAADQQATVLGEQGLITTEGTSHFKSLPNRVQEYAIVRGRLCEIYEFGGRTAEEILEQLLIDDGLASRKRRNTLMDPVFNYIGIGSSYHQSQQACTVIILAQDIISLVAPDSSGRYKRRKNIQSGKEIVFKMTDNVIMGNAASKFINNNANNDINNDSRNNPNHNNNFLLKEEPTFLQPESNMQNTVTNTNNNEPRFLLDDSSIQPASEMGYQGRTTFKEESEHRNTITPEEDYILKNSRQNDEYQRNSMNEQRQSTKHNFDEQAYINRQRERSMNESVSSGRNQHEGGGNQYASYGVGQEKSTRDGYDAENNLIVRETTTHSNIPNPVESRSTVSESKKDSKCSLM